MRSLIAWVLPAVVAACVPAVERAAPSPLQETSGVESLRVHGTVVVPLYGLEPSSARDFALRQLSAWAGQTLFAEERAALGGRFVRVTTRTAPAELGPIAATRGRSRAWAARTPW